MIGYPSGVVPDLPDEEMDFEDVRRTLRLGDDYDSMPNYFYAISLADRTIGIYDADSDSKPWKRGELLFLR